MLADDETQTLQVAERVLIEALELLRSITPEGWDAAYFHAIGANWHVMDRIRLKDARLLSMRAGGRL